MQHNNPLHGFTLQRIVELLVEDAGNFATLAVFLPMRCFQHEPSIKSALSFLRKTPWAREQVEQLFVKQQLHQDAEHRTVATLATQPAQPVPGKTANVKLKADKSQTAPFKTTKTATSSKPAGKRQTSGEQPPAKVWTGWTVPAKKS